MCGWKLRRAKFESPGFRPRRYARSLSSNEQVDPAFQSPSVVTGCECHGDGNDNNSPGHRKTETPGHSNTASRSRPEVRNTDTNILAAHKAGTPESSDSC